MTTLAVAADAVVVPHGVVVTAAAVLGTVVIALAGPVPITLSRAAWPARTPVVALLVWQAIGLFGGLSMIAALWLVGLSLAPAHPLLAALPALAFTLYLLAHLAVTVVHVNRQRARHHALLDLLTSPHPTRARTRVLDDAVPVAYCLPRGISSVTVLSQGLLDRLDADELVAVIAHERAHAKQRHDLLQLAFRAWRSALPWFPIAVRAETEIAELVEMLADDYARREVHDDVLARAILAVSEAGDDDLPSSRRAHDRFARLSAD